MEGLSLFELMKLTRSELCGLEKHKDGEFPVVQ
jgi:hypothetical protein